MAEQPSKRARYFPRIFDVTDIQRAKNVILTNEGPGASPEERWAIETPYILELMNQVFSLRSDMIVLDYGCGIGRIAKAMIDASGCSVIGLDISPNMRRLADDYVRSDRFIAVSPGQYDIMVRAGLRVHTAIAVWVLQHCLKPAEDIARIRRSVVPEGNIFVSNQTSRAVPAVIDDKKFVWINDGIDLVALLRTEFRVQAEGTPDKSRTPTISSYDVYWMDLRQHGN